MLYERALKAHSPFTSSDKPARNVGCR